MAAAIGESPEESPEVPEPNLSSLELEDLLARCLKDYEKGCRREEASLTSADGNDEDVEVCRVKYAQACIMEITATLKSFDPEISKERLSDDVYCILHSDAVIGKIGPAFKLALRQYLPRDRKEWLAEDIERHIIYKRARLRILRAKLTKVLGSASVQVVKLAKEPTTHVVVLSAGTGAVMLSVAGGVAGLASGVTIGTVVGTAPALLTFGLSIPISAAVGGGIGGGTGATLGALVGMVGGGAVGGVGCRYHVEIEAGILHVTKRASETAGYARTKALEATKAVRVKAADTAECVQTKASEVATVFTEATSSVANGVCTTAKEPRVQVTAASAAGGAVLVGAGGGAAGLVAGGTVGAAIGAIPALFTFGLSIPVGAAIGGGIGMCAGTTAGSAVGLVGGGATGYTLYPRLRK